jgi:hypothetical protein
MFRICQQAGGCLNSRNGSRAEMVLTEIGSLHVEMRSCYSLVKRELSKSILVDLQGKNLFSEDQNIPIEPLAAYTIAKP